MLRRDFLTAIGLGSAFTALIPAEAEAQQARRPGTTTPPSAPRETEQQFYERHFNLLTIKAQEPPYNAAENVFFITKEDIERIANETLAGTNSTSVAETRKALDLGNQRQIGFIKYVLEKSGFEPEKPQSGPAAILSPAQSTLDSVAAKLLSQINDDAPASISSRGDMMEKFLKGEQILSPEDAGKGSVLVGLGSRPQPLMNLIQRALLLDTRKLSPDLARLGYLNGHANKHEYGHHVMGHRDALAEQYGALLERKTAAEKGTEALVQADGAMKMWRDFRALHNILSDEKTLLDYSRTPQSLDYALSLSPSDLLAMDKAQMKERATAGHPPDFRLEGSIFKTDALARMDTANIRTLADFRAVRNSIIDRDVLNKGMQDATKDLAPVFKTRTEIFDEYLKIQKDAGQKPNALAVFQQAYNRDTYEKMSRTEKGEDYLSIMDDMEDMEDRSRKSAGPAPARGAVQLLDPATLRLAIEHTLEHYPESGRGRELLEGGLAAFDHWKDPVNMYGLTPNIVPESPAAPSPASPRRPVGPAR